MKVPGAGLAKGLAVTMRTMTKRSVTAHYPDAMPELPPRSRGVIALIEENCTVCMLCARECPAWCIYIDSHKDTIPATTEGGKDKSRNVLDRFAIDFSICMYCSICVEVCPFDALRAHPREGPAAGVDVDGARARRARRARRTREGDRRRAEGGRPGRGRGRAGG
jgi:formate hydrogenlyase subunit 6/NADH:ubiquinone oxidoreductase subunit I